MRRFLTMVGAALTLTALGGVMPEPAEAQKKRASTATQGPKKGQSTYRTPVTGRRYSTETAGRTRGLSTYRAAKVARGTKRTRGPKQQRTHNAQVSADQAARNRSMSVQSSRTPSEFLSRATYKTDTSRMSTDVNGRGAPRPSPSASGAQRSPQALLRPKPNAKLPAVSQSARQKGILVTNNRARKHGAQGVTFNSRDQFQSVGGRITTARNGRGTGPINAAVRGYKSLRSWLSSKR